MTLSIAVMAISNLPSIRFLSWNCEFGVGTTLTLMPFFFEIAFVLRHPDRPVEAAGKDDDLDRLWLCAAAAAIPKTVTAAIMAARSIVFITLSAGFCFLPRASADDDGNRERHVQIAARDVQV